MHPLDSVTTEGLPGALWKFLGDACGMRIDRLRMLPGREMPEPAKSLLVHRRDMTSTLAAFHGSALQVDLLQQRQLDGLYLREVFLRTVDGGRIAEYGVIAIALEHFTGHQQAAIRAGETPLGALLHKFHIPFVSSPIGFYSIPTASLAETHRALLDGPTCFGRFNHLAKPTGEPLAWIVEVLPPV